jgi:predicted  nucleic acid-binding Zn-ribbon protein
MSIEDIKKVKEELKKTRKEIRGILIELTEFRPRPLEFIKDLAEERRRRRRSRMAF